MALNDKFRFLVASRLTEHDFDLYDPQFVENLFFVLHKIITILSIKTFYRWQDEPSLADDYDYVMQGKVGEIV